jgi:hypothetical protein
MNRVMTDYYPLFELYQVLRSQLMAMLSDEDLSFRPDGENPPLGFLCREIGILQEFQARFRLPERGSGPR